MFSGSESTLCEKDDRISGTRLLGYRKKRMEPDYPLGIVGVSGLF